MSQMCPTTGNSCSALSEECIRQRFGSDFTGILYAHESVALPDEALQPPYVGRELNGEDFRQLGLTAIADDLAESYSRQVATIAVAVGCTGEVDGVCGVDADLPAVGISQAQVIAKHSASDKRINPAPKRSLWKRLLEML